MGVVAADFESRGTFDLFLTHLAEESHTLYRALDDGRFRDISHDRALAQPSLPYTGFGAAAFDEEGDGDLDLWVANGRVSGGFGAEGNRFAEANQRFVQTAEGRFETVSFGRAEISRGLAAGDIDGDGDEDVLIAQIDSATDLWINDHPSVKRLIIEAWLPDQRRHAIGAEIHLVGENTTRVARIDRSGSYLSAKPPYASFSLPEKTPSAVDVRWPDGSWERFPLDAEKRRWRLERGSGESR